MKFLIVGLGNVGEEYLHTRHNIGFEVITSLSDRFDQVLVPDRHAYTATIKYKGRQLIVMMPTTYMNLSGKAVRYHLDKHKIAIQNLLILTDDLALPLGKIKLKAKGSDGGHNGLKHIQDTLGTTSYPRLRFGIGSDFPKGRQIDYVLGKFDETERQELSPLIDKCVDIILSFATIGIDRTMNEYNKK